MSLDEIWTLLTFICNKTKGQYVSPEEVQLAINRGQMSLFESMLPTALVKTRNGVYEEDSKVMATLYVFKTIIEPFNVNSDGQAAYPTDWACPSSARKRIVIGNVSGGTSKFKQVKVRLVDDDKLGGILNSNIVPPAYDRPYYTMYKDFLQFYPLNIQSVVLTYLATPKDCVIGYTIVGGRPVYNSGTSVQLQWPEVKLNNIMILALQYMGINMQSNEIEGFAQTMSKEGI